MTEVSPRSKGAAFKAGWCWSEPGRSLLTCGKGFITRLGFRLCPADAWVPPCSLGRGCSGVGPIAAPLQTPPLLGGGQTGLAGSNPKHTLHGPVLTDVLETTAFQQLLPHASIPRELLEGGRVETYFERVTDVSVKAKASI